MELSEGGVLVEQYPFDVCEALECGLTYWFTTTVCPTYGRTIYHIFEARSSKEAMERAYALEATERNVKFRKEYKQSHITGTTESSILFQSVHDPKITFAKRDIFEGAPDSEIVWRIYLNDGREFYRLRTNL